MSPVTYLAHEIVEMGKEKFKISVQEKLNYLLHSFAIEKQQIEAWNITADWIFSIASDITDAFRHTRFLFEQRLPLSNDRPDVLVITDDAIFVVEAKTGTSESESSARNQTLRYARSVYNFLNISKQRSVVPVLLRANARNTSGHFCTDNAPTNDSIFDLDPSNLLKIIVQSNPPLDEASTHPDNWIYRPRPDIVDAARAMFNDNEVEEILDGLADDDELTRLISEAEKLVQEAKATSSHYVVTITGVPGAGKTLVGLRLVNSKVIQEACEVQDNTAPMYLSGNGPLVEVLTEALVRDATVNQGLKRQDALDAAMAKIRLVHGLTTKKFMVDAHVIVFDEAQRAWTKDRMIEKLRRQDLGSECEEVLKRMEDQSWSVVFCLIGTGQEINKGERGLETWISAVRNLNARPEFIKKWTIFLPSLASVPKQDVVEFEREDSALSLKVVRRAEDASSLSDWVEHLLSGEFEKAKKTRGDFLKFPIFVTRDLDVARRWLRRPMDARIERCGLVASSLSARLSSYGVDIPASASASFDWAQWFLDTPPNLNSSMLLEVAATEFKCQGLELDRVGVCWSWDLTHDGKAWVTRKIRRREGVWGRNSAGRDYSLASYRVLLTRARRGMVIWVPIGEETDRTRSPKEMNRVFDLLIKAGASLLSDDEFEVQKV